MYKGIVAIFTSLPPIIQKNVSRLKIKCSYNISSTFSRLQTSFFVFIRTLPTCLEWWYNLFINVPGASPVTPDHQHIAIETMTYGAFFKIICWYLTYLWTDFSIWYTEWKLGVSGVTCCLCQSHFFMYKGIVTICTTLPPIFQVVSVGWKSNAHGISLPHFPDCRQVFCVY